MARKCGIDMLLNKLWYRHLCSLSCTSMLRRVSIAWLSHVSKRCEMPRQAQPCRCISGLEFGSHAQAVGPGVAGEQVLPQRAQRGRSEEHTSELQSLMRISYAGFCLKKKKK